MFLIDLSLPLQPYLIHIYTMNMIHDVVHLVEEVEKKLGKTLSKTTDFEKLSFSFLTKYGVKLTPAKLKKVWNYVVGAEKPSQETLDTLALFVGFQSWKDFQEALHGKVDSSKNYED